VNSTVSQEKNTTSALELLLASAIRRASDIIIDKGGAFSVIPLRRDALFDIRSDYQTSNPSRFETIMHIMLKFKFDYACSFPDWRSKRKCWS